MDLNVKLFILTLHFSFFLYKYLKNMDSGKKCCPEGSWPALTVNYKPKGEKFNLADTTVYHVGDSQKVLIIISDIFGASSARHESVADTYAQLGYSVYLPQILITPYHENLGMNIMECIKSQNWEKMQARFKSLLEFLYEKGHKQFYGVGFCWGVWAGFKFSAKFEGFKGFVGFHPSLGLCGAFGESDTALVSSIKTPAFFCPAGNDPANVREGGELVKILEQRFGSQRSGTHSFPEQVHGWVVRGDISQQAVHRDVQKALNLSKEYFSKL